MNDDRRHDTARYDAQRIREQSAYRAPRPASPPNGSWNYSASSSRMASQREPAPRQTLERKQPVKRRRRHPFLRFMLWLVFVIAASLVISGVAWLLANDFCAFNKTPYISETVEVTKDDDIDTITQKLKDKNLIEYPWFFKLFAEIAHAENKIGIGSHTLTNEMDYNALINGMRSSSGSLNSETVRVAIPEGYNVRQVIAQLVKYGVSTEEELTEAAKNYEFSYSFLDSSKKGDITRLEGYLFPDTYEFYVGGNAATALGKMLSNFSLKMDEEMMQKVEASGSTLEDIITIASLIEKETDGSDRANISSVIYNRLKKAGETAYLLQIDASQIYGLGDRFTAPLTQAQLDIDTPYNTHLHEGLPPTPIANPGMASILAALEPADTNYTFYALGKDGVHHFFSSYSSFLNFVNSDQYAG